VKNWVKWWRIELLFRFPTALSETIDLPVSVRVPLSSHPRSNEQKKLVQKTRCARVVEHTWTLFQWSTFTPMKRKGPQDEKTMFAVMNTYGFMWHSIVVFVLNKYSERKIFILFYTLLRSIGPAPPVTSSRPRVHTCTGVTAPSPIDIMILTIVEIWGFLIRKFFIKFTLWRVKRVVRSLSIGCWQSLPRWRHGSLPGVSGAVPDP